MKREEDGKVKENLQAGKIRQTYISHWNKKALFRNRTFQISSCSMNKGVTWLYCCWGEKSLWGRKGEQGTMGFFCA